VLLGTFFIVALYIFETINVYRVLTKRMLFMNGQGNRQDSKNWLPSPEKRHIIRKSEWEEKMLELRSKVGKMSASS
jgi:hypothetical protein